MCTYARSLYDLTTNEARLIIIDYDQARDTLGSISNDSLLVLVLVLILVLVLALVLVLVLALVLVLERTLYPPVATLVT